MKLKLNIKNQKFGRLTVLSDTGKRDKRGCIIWLCKCDCGEIMEVPGYRLKSGHTRSCGCLKRERMCEIYTIHGDSPRNGRTRLCNIWYGIRQRCLNPKQKRYKHYGGKGIKICDEWKDSYMAFKLWALTNGYRDDLTIDRINNDGNYCPENCRWISLSENVRNSNFNRKKVNKNLVPRANGEGA